ncbi:helix-turn-helix domain-containing protein [Actinoplanes sp. NPDC051851]|uniref:TetR/AcrR family transcriptional regulator n=1 Tax=Actinoplanes sp. NPDC051851 TaxID=3154753 RepID=UPI003419AB60
MRERPDRRVVRNRSALMAAAVRLVSERGTTAVPAGDLADAAQVSRQLVYLQFGDRDALLVAAAHELVRSELIPVLADGERPLRERALATARHFAGHRPFYRAMLVGSCSFAMTRALNRALGSLVTPAGLRAAFGDLPAATAGDVVTAVTAGAAAIVNDWIVEGDDPLDPRELTGRLAALAVVLRGRDLP